MYPRVPAAARHTLTHPTACHHENIVNYIGSYLYQDSLWIVMEFCAGGSVGDILRTLHEPFKEPQIAVILRESLKVCAAF